MAKYFDRFGLINYNGQIVRNILTKVDLTQSSKNEIQSKFEFQMDENITRSDHLSYVVYDSPFYDWVIFLTNSVIDPYNDLYMREDELIQKIKTKYSTLENSRNVVLFYRNNWADDDDTITISEFDNLTTNIKKYYDPVISNSNQIISYKRAEIDWIQSTNRIQELYVTNSKWIKDSGYVSQGNTSANIVKVDRENNIVMVNHIDGNFEIGSFEGTEITEINTLVTNIPEEESRFWSKVTAWDVENEENELKRFISLLRKSYVYDFETSFKEKIK